MDRLKCHECRYLMFDYMDGKLDEATRLEMEQHAAECKPCGERMAKLHREQEEERMAGMFWYLLQPSGGFKRMFLAGAFITFILVILLISTQIKKPLF